MTALLATAGVLVAAVVVTVVYEMVRAVLAPGPASAPARPGVGSGTSAARPKAVIPSTAAAQGVDARQPGLHHPTDVRSSPQGERGVLAHWTSPGPPSGCEVHGPGQTASHPVPSARRPSTD